MNLPLSPLLATIAQDAGPNSDPGDAPSSGIQNLMVPMILIIGIFYFILIRPERKKQKERTTMLGGMKKGDKVMTSAGIYGTIAQTQEDVVTLQVADGVRMRFNRAAIQTIITDGKTSSEKPLGIGEANAS